MSDEAPWPTAFLAGVPKAGTTSLFRYLSQHPDIAPSRDKETYLLNRAWDEIGDPEAAKEEAEGWYEELFARAGDAPVRLEGTPGYFAHPDVAERVRDVAPEARVIVSLRDPVERAFSEYLMNRREGVWERPLAEMVEDELDAGPENRPSGLLWTGFYATHLDRWRETLGEDRVLVVLLEDLKEDPQATLERVAGFLGVDPAPMREVDTDTQHNPYREPRNPLAAWLLDSTAVRRAARALVPEPLRIVLGERVLSTQPDKPEMDPAVRRRLRELYAPEMDRLEQRLGREVPWPREPES